MLTGIGTQPVKSKMSAKAALRILGFFAAGLLFSGGRMLDGLYPLGLALAFGLTGRDGWAAAAGVALGSVLFHGPVGAVPYLCALGLYLVLTALLPWHYTLLFCGLGLAGAQGALLLAGLAQPQSLVLQLVNALAACLLATALQKAGPYGATGKQLLYLFAALALERFGVGGWQPALTLAGLLCLVQAARGGQNRALTAAILAGAAYCCAEPACAFGAVGLAVGTLAAEYFGSGDRLLVSALWAFGLVCSCICARPANLAFGVLGSAAPAVLAFWLLPARVWQQQETPETTTARRMTALSDASVRLAAVADGLSEVSQTINKVYAALPQGEARFSAVTDSLRAELCEGCGRRELCWGEEAANTREGFAALRPLLEQQGQILVEQLPRQLCRCLHPVELCSAAGRAFLLLRQRRETRLQTQALRTALTEQYEAIAGSLRRVAEQMNGARVPERYRTARLENLFASLGLEPLECGVVQDSLGRLQASVTLAHRAFTGEELEALQGEVEHLCRCTMAQPQQVRCRNVTTLLFSEAPLFRAQFGTAGFAARQGVSGDATDAFCDSFGNACLLLCDGMGVGRAAAVDGAMAANLTGRLLRAGFAAESAARLVNVALALKGEEESSSTLDLVQVDLNSGQARVYKAGAAPGFWVHEGVAREINAPGLPVGILGGVVGRQQSFRLAAGDWVVLVSDGALLDGNTWICQQLELSHKSGETPQAAAEQVVRMARQRAESTHRQDDITAAVLALMPSRL